MKVEVLIPTRNRLAMLSDALDSARSQTYPDLEILVSDDSSTDGTAAYLAKVATTDKRVHVVPRNPQPGLFENIRHLTHHASAPAVCILSDDDVLDPRYVEELVKGLEANSSVIAFAGHRYIGHSGRIHRLRTWRAARRYSGVLAGRLSDPTMVALKGYMWLGSCMFRREVLADLGFDPACGMAADWDLLIRASRVGPVYHVPELLWSYRLHATTMSRAACESALEHRRLVLDKYQFAEPHHEQERLRLRRDWLLSCVIAVRGRPRRSAFRCLREYLRRRGPLLSPRFVVACALAVSPVTLVSRFVGAVGRVRDF